MRSRILVALIAALLIVSFAGCRTAPRNADGTKMTKAERKAAAREAKEQARDEKRAKAEAKHETRQSSATPAPVPAPAPTAVAPSAPSMPASAVVKTKRIALNFDRGITSGMSPQQERAQNQLADWMERDLRSMLSKNGYTIDEHSDTALHVKITDYNPGSTAARVWVGYGAGAASLNIHYGIIQNGRTVKADDIGVGSSQSWQKCARKLNTDTVSSMNGVLK